MRTMTFLFLFLPAGVAHANGNASAIRQSYTLETAKNYEGAIRSVASVYNANPKDFFVNLRLGWLNYLNGNFKNALVHYDAALSENGKSVSALLGKINILSAQYRWSEAEPVARKLTSLLRNNYEATLKLANICLAAKKFDDAAEVLSDLTPFFPDSTELLNTLGYAQMMKGDRAEAQATFLRVKAMSPDDAVAQKRLAELGQARK